MLKRSAVIIAVIAILNAGCGMRKMSDDNLLANTAGVLGVLPSEVNISNRNQQSMNTYYIAKTKSGQEYACVLEAGDPWTGMGDPPQCHRKGESTHRPFDR